MELHDNIKSKLLAAQSSLDIRPNKTNIKKINGLRINQGRLNTKAGSKTLNYKAEL